MLLFLSYKNEKKQCLSCVKWFILLSVDHWQVHRHYWSVSCKSCRRTFTGSSVSPGLRRFSICDSCNCVTTTRDDSAPVHPTSQPEPMDRADGATDWSSFMDDVDEVEVGRVEDLVEKQMLERQLAVCTDVGHTLWIWGPLDSEKKTISWTVSAVLFPTVAILLLISNYCMINLFIDAFITRKTKPFDIRIMFFF